MKLHFPLYLALVVTSSLGFVACHKQTKLDNPCASLIEMKKCPGTQAAISTIEEQCSVSFRTIEQTSKDLATDYSKVIKDCGKGDNCQEINNCLTIRRIEYEKKIAEQKK